MLYMKNNVSIFETKYFSAFSIFPNKNKKKISITSIIESNHRAMLEGVNHRGYTLSLRSMA